jgi:hypothetical protein
MESQQDAVFVPAPEKQEASEPVYFLTEPEPEASEQPVYFLNGDPDSLHADRSPYTFEPASQGPASNQVPSPGAGQGVMAASNEDFVIKQHTYQMCPNCPTFSIPIPVPKSSASQVSEVVNPYTIDPGYEYQHGEEPVSLFSRLSSLLSPIIASARASLAPLLGDSSNTLLGHSSNSLEPSTFSDRLSTVGGSTSDNGPLLMAGMAAAGLGVAALLSSSMQLLSLGGGVGRAFGEQEDEGNSVGSNSLGGALADYNMQDILCMPRVYCEKMKRRKHVIDQYPNTKKVAAWLVGRLFDRDMVYSKEEEEPLYNKCNLRECLLALLD